MSGARASLAPPADLTVPTPGSTTAQQVLSAALRRLLADLAAVLSPARTPVGEDALQREVMAAVRGAMAAEPGAMFSVLRRADVGAWVRCLRPGGGGVADRAAGVRALGGTLALAMASLGILPGAIRIGRPPGRLSSLAGRARVDVPAGASAAIVAADRVVFEGVSEGPGEVSLGEVAGRDDAFAPIVGDLVLALVDDNPLAAVEAHPEKSGNALDLGGEPASAWVAALAEALGLVEAQMPELRREIDLVVQQVVPVGSSRERHLSASFQEAIGTVYLSLHPQPLTMVEALIHEFSHNKLNALLEVDPVLENAFTSLHRSPVRPDPRPLHGLLLAVHAFLPVARFYEALIASGDPRGQRPEVRRRFLQIIEGNHEGVAVVAEHGRPTAIGAALVDELVRLDRHFVALAPMLA